jgi:TetR/AcrR family transcriptional regulator, regulator of cefoperazone and chloramphenicol sensitivity
MKRSSQCRDRPPAKNSSERKRRVLEVACRLFARRGFDGAHVREICKLAGVNIASICYHFRDKQGIYEAVQAEARERLSHKSKGTVAAWYDITPEEKLQAIIESLFARLRGDSAWIAHLLIRELIDGTKTSKGTVSEGLGDDLALLESTIRDAVGPKAEVNTVRLDALNVLAQCVFYCAAMRTLMRISPKSDEPALTPQNLVRHLTVSSLRGLADVASQRKAP